LLEQALGSGASCFPGKPIPAKSVKLLYNPADMTRTLTTLILIFALLLAFPLLVGVLGGLFGAVIGVFGAVFGIVAGVFGTIAGIIGGIFGLVFGLAEWNFLTVILVVVLLVLLVNRK